MGAHEWSINSLGASDVHVKYSTCLPVTHTLYLTSDLPLAILFRILSTLSPLVTNAYVLT